MRSLRDISAIGLLIVGFVGGTIFMVLAFTGPRGLPQHATTLPQSMSLPQFSLLDQHGSEFNKDSFNGHWSLVFFGFTHCPDICPATLTQLAMARSRMLAAGATDFPHIVLVSVDPERDSPEVMADYVGRFGDGITGVTGRLDELRKLTSALGIYFAKSKNETGGYGIDHSAVVIVVNENAEFQALFRAPHIVDHFVTDMPLITGQK